jgi:hypothetical protein
VILVALALVGGALARRDRTEAATYRGSAAAAQPIVGIATTTSGRGYWMVAADGGLFTFGNARFYGSSAGRLGGQQAVGMATSPDGNGYLIASQWGAVNTGSASGFKVDPKLLGRGPQPVANELVRRINTERATRGLAPLAADPLLQRYAHAHANHLAATGSFAHQNLMPILNASGGRMVVVQDFASPMGVTLQSHPTPPLRPLAAPNLSGARC